MTRLGVGRGQRLGCGDPGAHRLLRLPGDRLEEVVSQQAQSAEVALVAADALVRALGLHALRIDVGARVVSRRVRRTAVRDSFDEGRAVARPRARDRLPCRLVDGQDVSAVDADSGHPVTGRLVGESRRTGLRLERGRDRPAVVVAEEDRRRAHHGREVGAFVERALRGSPVAEVRNRARRLAAELLPPGEADRVGHVGRDRDRDRGDTVLARDPTSRPDARATSEKTVSGGIPRRRPIADSR